MSFPYGKYPVYPPTAAEGRITLLEQFRVWHRTANPEGLLGKTLQLGDRIEEHIAIHDPPLTHECDHFTFPAQRPLPRGFDEGLSGVELHIVKILRCGMGSISQVYEAKFARVASRNVPTPATTTTMDGSSTTTEWTRCVVKIYQTSAHVQGPAQNDSDVSEKRWRRILCRYMDEAWAYARLRRFHRSVVPHIAGLYVVELEHGEPAVALVIEYIENRVLSADVPIPVNRDPAGLVKLGMPTELTQAEIRMLKDLVRGLIVAIHALFSCGISHSDLAPRNLLWPSIGGDNPDPLSCIPVIIDYDYIRPSSGASQWKASITGSAMLTVLNGFGFSKEHTDETTWSMLKSDTSILEAMRFPDDDRSARNHLMSMCGII